MKYPYKMTEEIAFKLGRLSDEDFPSLFYDSPTWYINDEDFLLYNFFKWSHPHQTGRAKIGKTISLETPPEDIEWRFCLSGSLDESKFETIEQKLAYLRGRLTNYSVKKEPNSIYVCYANSYGSRDRFAKWTKDVIYDKFSFTQSVKVTTGETTLSCPGTPWVELEAHEDVVKYITG
jgi:hypothetical protein